MDPLAWIITPPRAGPVGTAEPDALSSPRVTPRATTRAGGTSTSASRPWRPPEAGGSGSSTSLRPLGQPDGCCGAGQPPCWPDDHGWFSSGGGQLPDGLRGAATGLAGSSAGHPERGRGGPPDGSSAGQAACEPDAPPPR